MPVTMPNAFSMNGRLPPRKKPVMRPQPPARSCRRRPGRSAGPGTGPVAQVSTKNPSPAASADLDRLGPRPHLAQRQDARRRPAHQDEEVAEPRAEGQARQQAEREGDHQGEMRVVGDRQDHRREGHRDQLGVPGLGGQQPGDRQRRRRSGRRARRSSAGCRRSSARCGRRSSRSARTGRRPARRPTRPARTRSAQGQLGDGRLVLQAEQGEVVLGDLLVLRDEDVARCGRS